MNIPEILITHDAAHVGVKASEEFVRITQRAVQLRGRAAVALSGGGTVHALLERLVSQPLRDLVPWERVDLFWSDERLVPATDGDSNHGVALREYLAQLPIPQENLHLPPMTMDSPAAAAAAYEEEIRRCVDSLGSPLPRFDLVFLGLGPDGHIASLFPGAAASWDWDRLVLPSRSDTAMYDRITFSPTLLLGASRIVVLVSGDEKAGILQTVLESAADVDRYPAQVLEHAQGHVIWILDAAAATGLSRGQPTEESGPPWW
jgi:6-phosphogluconolactonase